MVEKLCDGKAYKNQRKYMERIQKPNKMGFEQWICRIKYMQDVLPKLTEGDKKYKVEDLIDGITNVSPIQTCAKKFVLMGEKSLTSVKKIKDLLEHIEEAMEITSK